MHNAVRRAGSGVPVRLSPDDFEVIETEALTRSATVLLLDLSLSMPMRDNFVPAKKMAMALHTLISTRFPRDYLGLVGFSEVARVIEPEDLPTVSWDYVYGTNLQHGLILARKMLAHQQGTKQIILVTDGEPTAHVIPYEGGVGYDVFFNYPPVPETLEVTLAEVMRCTRAGITINTFLLDPDRGPPGLRRAAGPDQPGPDLRHLAGRTGRLRAGRLPGPQDHAAHPGPPGRLSRRPASLGSVGRHRPADRAVPRWRATPQRHAATVAPDRPLRSRRRSEPPPGRARTMRSCSQAGFSCVCAPIGKDDISVVTSVLCGSGREPCG